MLEEANVAIVGIGNIGQILITRLLAAGVSSRQILVSDVDASRAQAAHRQFAVTPVALADDRLSQADMFLIATPPKAVPEVARALAGKAHAGQVFVSFAAAVPIHRIEMLLPAEVAVVRVMPSAPALIGQGLNPVCFGRGVTVERRRLVEELLSALGDTVVVADEQMNWCVGLAGAAMRSLLPVLEGLVQAGLEAGLEPEAARRIAAQIMRGTADLVLQTDHSFDEMKRLTPMQTLDEAATSQLFREAARAAKEKTDQLQMRLLDADQ